MPSPFPGMDPYLEQPDVWPDFHARFIAAAAMEIGRRVRPRYFVRIEEQVYLHERSADERTPLGRPDIGIHSANRPSGTALAETSSAPMTVYVPAAIDEVTIRHLEIRDAVNRNLVTVIELLSPSNKTPGLVRARFIRKTATLMASSANFVMIDLLRGGPRMPLMVIPPCDYCVVSRTASRRPDADCWAFGLRDPLPNITVPLREGEPLVWLDLKALLDKTYHSAGYELSIYTGTPDPPLVPDDEAWAKSLLAGAGLPA